MGKVQKLMRSQAYRSIKRSFVVWQRIAWSTQSAERGSIKKSITVQLEDLSCIS